MKRTILFFHIFLFLFYFEIEANNNTNLPLLQIHHKYVTWCAWEVVKIQHPEVIWTEMDNRVSDHVHEWNDAFYDGEGHGPYWPPYILTGAFKEDEEDIIHFDGSYFSPNTSCTHFWDADQGDYYYTTCPTWPTTYENSYMKSLEFWYGHLLNSQAGSLIVGPFQYNFDVFYYVRIKYNTLGEALKNHDNVWVTHWWDPTEHTWWEENPPQPFIPYIIENTNPSLTEEEANGWLNRVLWTSVGRMCHLIEDMGVPAHAHNNMHPYETYEKDFLPSNALRWGPNDAINQGGLINLNDKNYPIRFVIYTANQIADRFSSNGRSICHDEPCMCNGIYWTVPGDLSFQSRFPESGNPYDSYNIIQDMYNNITAPVEMCPIYNNYCDAIAENAFVYSIRAVAGFLWYVYNQSLPNEIVLQNKVVHTGTSVRYQALYTISAAGPDNNNNPTTYIVEPYGNCVFQSGNTIYLKNGFHAEEGSDFHAFMTGGSEKVNLQRFASSHDSLNIDNSITKTISVPDKYFLNQNYPNPFNPVTTIKYGLKKDVNVALKIYNILGQEVKTLIEEFETAGYKNIIWDGKNNDGRDVSSGVYLLKIIAGDFTDVKKMLILK